MTKTRFEAFSDAVIAIALTIMVLELRPPHSASLQSLRAVFPSFLCYVLSYIYLGIYWNNHHHMVHMIRRVNGAMLWANLHLLFWLSLFPFVTAWMAETRAAQWPTALYGSVTLMAAIAYYILQSIIIAEQGSDSPLAEAVGRDWKGKLSPLCYAASIGLAFVLPAISVAIFAAVALIWLVPDRRIESRFTE